MCEELRADLCQIKNEQKETQNQVYLLEATIRKLREDNFEAEMVQVELKSERDLALEQAKNAQVCTPIFGLLLFRNEFFWNTGRGIKKDKICAFERVTCDAICSKGPILVK